MRRGLQSFFILGQRKISNAHGRWNANGGPNTINRHFKGDCKNGPNLFVWFTEVQMKIGTKSR